MSYSKIEILPSAFNDTHKSFQKSQIKGSKNQNDTDVCNKPLPKSILEE